MALDEKAEQNRTMLEHTNLFADDETRQSLDECKIQVTLKKKIYIYIYIYIYINVAEN